MHPSNRVLSSFHWITSHDRPYAGPNYHETLKYSQGLGKLIIKSFLKTIFISNQLIHPCIFLCTEHLLREYFDLEQGV